MADEKQVDTFLDGVTYSRDVWTLHPTLATTKKDADGKPLKDSKTKRVIGAVKQKITLDFTGVTKEQMCAKMGATYIIKYQSLAREKLAMLQDDKGNTINEVNFKIVDLFTGKTKMSDSERINKGIEKCSDLEQLEAINKRTKEKIEALKKTAADAITHR